MQSSGSNLSTGFYASAVDIGRLQAALVHGLARFEEDAQHIVSSITGG
jgi:hypothetical protein